MIDKPKWIPKAESECIRNWTKHLHTQAKQLLIEDGTHANMLFLFNKENGLVSVDLVPPNIAHDQLNVAMENAINQHDLYGIILIGEAWVYVMKEKDHTTVQLLDGEMRVSDLNPEDTKEALMVRMENSDGDSLLYFDEIIRDENGVSLKDGSVTESSQKRWFVHNDNVL